MRLFLVLAVVSLIASASLVAVPLVSREAVLAPLLIINWLGFVGSVARLERGGKVTSQQCRAWRPLLVFEVLAFIGAAWFALSSGSPVL
jgi:hypothetical protein